MGKIVVVENLSLDGVMQAPGRPDEDPRGGFRHGGWAVPYGDEVMAARMGRSMAGTGVLMLGRVTYEGLAAYWPHQPDNPYTDILNRTPKYVVSRTLSTPLPWQNSILLPGDVDAEVGRLKSEVDGDLFVLGSGQLVRSLHRAGLVDRYELLVFPLTLGAGLKLFPEDAELTGFRLADSVVTTKGVIIATYERG